MASTTRNLRLVLDDNLSTTARSNLQKLDALGAVFNLDNTASAIVRSAVDIHFRPEDASIGGSGTGGAIVFGSASQPATSITFYADSVAMGDAVSLPDQGTSGTKSLLLKYNSTVSGAVDTTSNRTLQLDLNGADRSLVLGGNFSLLGGHAVQFTTSGAVAWTLPASDTFGILTNNGSGTLSWSSAGSGTLSSVGLSAPAIFTVGSSPLTSNGTLSLSLASQAANLVWAGPASGGSAAPTFRSLVAADLSGIVGFRRGSAAWVPADGATKIITHSWGTRKIHVDVLDDAFDYSDIEVSISRPTDNTIVLTANETPPSNWTVIYSEVT